jgi:cytochrome b involved in lipid metabolism
VLMAFAGKDATERFEKVGHSDHALLLLQQLAIGPLGDEASLGEPVRRLNPPVPVR